MSLGERTQCHTMASHRIPSLAIPCHPIPSHPSSVWCNALHLESALSGCEAYLRAFRRILSVSPRPASNTGLSRRTCLHCVPSFRPLPHRHSIVDNHKGPVTPHEGQLAALTAESRTIWAETREVHFSRGENRMSLNIIERAMFVVVLEDRRCVTRARARMELP